MPMNVAFQDLTLVFYSTRLPRRHRDNGSGGNIAGVRICF